MSRVLIIGYGVVGQNMAKIFPDATIHDVAKDHRAPVADGDEPLYDVGFVCVPTDSREDGSADTAIVESAIVEWAASCDVICIKSTVPPTFTQRMISRGYRVVMSPEYFGATAHANAARQQFVILGGDPDNCRHVAEAYKERFPADLQIRYTDATTAELVKYGENAFLATKVAFVNEWARICSAFYVNFDQWRELWLLDERISPSHTFVYRDHPYYDSHCLNKDIPAVLAACYRADYHPEILATVESVNRQWRENMEDLW
jgi:UDPglucose 6-dehydrogenase